MQRILSFSAITWLLCHTALGEPQPKAVTLHWSPDQTSQAVCVEKRTWLVAVEPPRSETFFESPRIEGFDGSLQVLYRDEEQSLCLLEASKPLKEIPPISLSADWQVTAGAKLNCISMSDACSSTIAGKDWSFQGKTFSAPLLRIRLARQGKFCTPGTPLLNEDGHLQGLLTPLHDESSGEAYAIPACRIQKVVHEFSHHHRSGPIWVGLVFENNTSTPEVLEVKPNSPSSRADLKRGDVILAVDDHEIEELNDLVEIFHSLPAGVAIQVQVLRGLEKKTLKITPQFAAAAK